MQETAIQAGTPAPSPAPTPPVSAPTSPELKRALPEPLYQILEFCASLRITVVLFLLSFILVFYGTWAQVDAGIWTVVKEYFRGWFVAIPLKIVFLRLYDIPSDYWIPFPAGWTLGTLLMINLLAAHAIRFKLSWKRSGILLLHSGLILMMAG